MSTDDRVGDDSRLILGYLNGDKGAFALLVKKYEGRVYFLLYAVLQYHHLAEELGCEAFVRASRNLNKLRKAERFGAWLFKISLNLAYREAGRHARSGRAEAQIVDYACVKALIVRFRQSMWTILSGVSSEGRKCCCWKDVGLSIPSMKAGVKRESQFIHLMIFLPVSRNSDALLLALACLPGPSTHLFEVFRLTSLFGWRRPTQIEDLFGHGMLRGHRPQHREFWESMLFCQLIRRCFFALSLPRSVRGAIPRVRQAVADCSSGLRMRQK